MAAELSALRYDHVKVEHATCIVAIAALVGVRHVDTIAWVIAGAAHVAKDADVPIGGPYCVTFLIVPQASPVVDWGHESCRCS